MSAATVPPPALSARSSGWTGVPPIEDWSGDGGPVAARAELESAPELNQALLREALE